MVSHLQHLIKISRHYGGNERFVIAGGGNTSLKTRDRLFIKASGHALATIGPEGFVEIDRPALDDILDTEFSSEPAAREAEFLKKSLAARCNAQDGKRPSVELVLHHLMPEAYVVHSHSTVANALTCSQHGESLAAEWFGDDVLWVPYVDPGYVLARTLQRLLEDYRKRTGRRSPNAVLLQNHGLLVSGDSADEIHERTHRVLRVIERRLKPARTSHSLLEERSDKRRVVETIAPILRGLLSEGADAALVTFDDSAAIMRLLGDKQLRSEALRGPLTPDQIVYCKSFPLFFRIPVKASPQSIHASLNETVAKYRQKHSCMPRVVLVEGVGMFAAGSTISAALAARDVYRDAAEVMAAARALGGVNCLTSRQYRFIENWEAESYRQKTGAGPGQSGRVAGKIALVTGSAQGIGREIAQDLAAQGAHVALVDLNLDGVKRAAAEIQATYGRGRAIALAANVTDAASVAESIHQIVRAYGGLDILVSNAGVLKAGSVKTMPGKDFRFVTDVNYLGYFHYVQAAAPVMAAQCLARPRAWTDIIQINSKSGLAGSNRNSAYAGSKFGGIGLTQSFAMELVEDRIKVNSICPGNFFDGPLWSDPRDGLFAQYLRTGKVPGAKTIQDVRRFYEQKVPMGRGTEVADIMKAIYYAIEQEYETGQAIPVTGGQVMLR